MAKKKTKKTVRAARARSRKSSSGQIKELKLTFRGVGVIRRLGSGKYEIVIVDSPDSPVLKRRNAEAEIKEESDIVREIEKKYSVARGDCIFSGKIKFGLGMFAPALCTAASCAGTCSPVGGGIGLEPKPLESGGHPGVTEVGSGELESRAFEVDLQKTHRTFGIGCTCGQPGKTLQ